MFSGIIEEFATVVAIKKDRENIDFTLKCSFVDELKIDQSVAHNGVCLTVCNPTSNTFQVAIIPYTFEHTNFCDIRVGTVVNLEFDILGKYIARLQQL